MEREAQRDGRDRDTQRERGERHDYRDREEQREREEERCFIARQPTLANTALSFLRAKQEFCNLISLENKTCCETRLPPLSR